MTIRQNIGYFWATHPKPAKINETRLPALKPQRQVKQIGTDNVTFDPSFLRTT
jgi:hypothetical protein